jgi:hypothetical protein
VFELEWCLIPRGDHGAAGLIGPETTGLSSLLAIAAKPAPRPAKPSRLSQAQQAAKPAEATTAAATTKSTAAEAATGRTTPEGWGKDTQVAVRQAGDDLHVCRRNQCPIQQQLRGFWRSSRIKRLNQH